MQSLPELPDEGQEGSAGDLDELADVQDGGGPFAAAYEVVGEGAADAEDFGAAVGTSRRAASSSRVMLGCSVSVVSQGGIR